MEYSETSGFWIFNQVQNFVYTRYNTIHPEVAKVQSTLENEFISYTDGVDAAAKALYEKNPEQAVAFLTNYSNSAAERTFNTWKKLYRYLFVKYMDGNIKTAQTVKENYRMANPKVVQPGYGEAWYRRIVKETGDQFLVK
jgi:dipeptidase